MARAPASDAAGRPPRAEATSRPPGPEPFDRTAFGRGLRAGAPFAAASGLVALSFGTLAVDTGFPVVAAIAMSAIVFAGSAQFAALTIVGAGGGLGAAVLAALLVNSRFLPMGVALAPSLPGGPLRRAAQGQAIVDASWAMAARPDGTFDRSFLFGSTAIQYVTWFVGTALGAFGGGLLGDTDRLGFDAIFPTFFLVLLIHELRSGRGRGVAALGALIALALIPFVPTGVPVLAASAAALVGLRRRSPTTEVPRANGPAGSGVGPAPPQDVPGPDDGSGTPEEPGTEDRPRTGNRPPTDVAPRTEADG